MDRSTAVRSFIASLVFGAGLFFGGGIAFATENSIGDAAKLNAELPDPHASKRKLTLSSFVEIPTHSFLISTGAGRVDRRQVDQRIQYNPTIGPNVGVRGTYDFWTLSLSKRLSFVGQQDVQTYGQSDYDDWRVGYYFTKTLLLESYYQNYRGFYTDLSGQEGLQTSFGSGGNQSSLSSGGPSQIVNRSDVSALSYGLRATYVLPLMSIFRSFSTDKEKESMNWDFNFLTKAYYNRLGISGDRPLVPASLGNSFSPIASLKESWSNTLGVGVGLGVAVPASQVVSFGFDAILGAGLQRQTNVFVDRESVAYTIAQEMNANLYLDWRGDSHGFRFGVYLDALSSKVDDINLDTSSLGLNLVYTYSGISL